MPTTPIVADAKLCDTEGDLGELESFFSARFNPGIGVGIVQESAPFGCDFVLQGEFETVGVDLANILPLADGASLRGCLKSRDLGKKSSPGIG